MIDRDAAHQYLDLLLNISVQCDEGRASAEVVQSLLENSIAFARMILGEDTFARAMRSGEQGDGLLLLANRFAQMKPLLKDGWPDDFTFDDIVSELFAVAHGDAPTILKRPGKKGQSKNAHALLERKLEAHAWYKVLGRLGLKAGERQLLLMSSHHISIEAFNKWRQEAQEKLGANYVERYFVTAEQTHLFAARERDDPLAWAQEQMRQAGTNYRHELDRSRG